MATPALLADAVAQAPRVVAFARGWHPAAESPARLHAIRAALRGLGAELVVLSDRGVWWLRPDDAPDAVADPAATHAALAAHHDVADGTDAVFVLDGDGVVQFAHRPEDSIADGLADALGAAADAMLAGPRVEIRHVRRAGDVPGERTGWTRRAWLTSCLVAGFSFTFLRGCKRRDDEPAPAAAPLTTPGTEIAIDLDINGQRHHLVVEPRVSLLDALRERLGLTGTKKGCDAGQCGACTVHVGGERVLACLTLAVMAQGKPITTIEGLATGDQLHPMQHAFVEHDGLQCGYCTPGQIMSAVALLREKRATSDDEVREHMSGNLCRCGAYPNIVAAIQAARKAT